MNRKANLTNIFSFTPTRAIALALALLIALNLPAKAIDRAHYRDLQKQFGERAQKKDWQGARRVLAEMGKELPALTPRYILTAASVEARLGHKDEALSWLERFAATGLSFDLAKDDDLKALLAETRGQKVAAQMRAS